MVESCPQADEFQHLRAGDPVTYTSEACLIVRRAGMSCGLCREICPADVLAGGEWSITLEAEGCIGCGLCAAVCPAGALNMDGFRPLVPETAGGRIVLECRRVAADDRDPQAIVVPCLGGLTAPDLMEAAGSGAAIVVADHGWCAACPVSHRADPWHTALSETKALLSTISAQLAGAIDVERRDLAPDRARPVMAALRPDKQVGRRDLLRRLTGTNERRDSLAESRRAIAGRGLVKPIKRKRLLKQISALAASRGMPMPPALMPAVKIVDGCELSGLCAAICPTGALRRAEENGTTALEFDAADCMACGECQRVCPRSALSLWPAGDGTVRDAPATLIERSAAICEGCGDTFTGESTMQFCPTCRKTMSVMREFASWKFGTPVSS